MDRAWKQYERRLAKVFDTRRNPLSGMGSGVTASDTRHVRLFIDAKLRREFKTVVRYFTAIEGLAEGEGKLPVLITQVPSGRTDKSLVTVRLRDVHHLVALLPTTNATNA